MSGLPYRSDLTGEWFTQVITRDVEPLAMASMAILDMINLNSPYDDRFHIITHMKLGQIHREAGDKIYFHGTDARSAQIILERGLSVVMTKPRQDFSDGYGFYVTDDYETAFKWANHHEVGGAVIAFQISNNLYENVKHLSLEVATGAGRDNWQRIVTCCRNRRYDPTVLELLHNVKFIEGPVNKNPYVGLGQIPIPDNVTQMCIRDADYAKVFGSLQNIRFIIFVKSR